MKRLWIGMLAVAVLLAGGILASLKLASVHKNLSGQLEAAATAAEAEDMEKAHTLLINAEQYWNKHRAFSAAFSDHEPIEELDMLFSQAQICKNLNLTAQYALVCSQLSHVCAAIAEAMELTWWNLL